MTKIEILMMMPPSNKTKIWIIKRNPGESEADATFRALDRFEARRFFRGNERILIKPNWIIAEHYSQGNTTSTETLEGIVHYLLAVCKIPANQIIVGDGGYPSDTDECMRINQVGRLHELYGVDVRNLNNEPMLEKHPENPLALQKVNVAGITDNVDIIISVPSLKVHSMAVTTLAMKNLMGMILPKGIMHGKLPKKIADLCSLFRSKMRFSVIDGFIGSDGYEEGGNPVDMGLLVLGEDPVAVDTIGSLIMGYEPTEVPYLALAASKGLGTCNPDEIEIVGPPIAQIQKHFKRN
jgi:uncharacterized protein (DUF362 family)